MSGSRYGFRFGRAPRVAAVRSVAAAPAEVLQIRENAALMIARRDGALAALTVQLSQ